MSARPASARAPDRGPLPPAAGPFGGRLGLVLGLGAGAIALLLLVVGAGGMFMAGRASADARPAPDTAPLPAARRPCPATPNCVGSTQVGAAAMPPLAYVGDRATTEARLRAALAAGGAHRLVTADGDRWHVEFTTRVFRFVDDLHVHFDDASRVVHFRSASRVGESDLGANRTRMTAIAGALRGAATTAAASGAEARP